MSIHTAQEGFTLMELLVVISLVVVILGMSVAGFRNQAQYRQYSQAVGDVSFTIQQARTNARLAVDDSVHGVKILPDSVVYFIGDTYSAAAPTNEVSTYSLATFQPTLTNGVDEITFSKLTGLPSATGTISVTGTLYEGVTTLEISDSGVIQ